MNLVIYLISTLSDTTLWSKWEEREEIFWFEKRCTDTKLIQLGLHEKMKKETGKIIPFIIVRINDGSILIEFSWHNDNCHKKSVQRPEFKSWTRRFAYKVWIVGADWAL